MKALTEALEEGKSAVIDNTNKSKEERSRYTTIAKKFKVPCRCFYFDIPKELALHLNNQRETNTSRKQISKKVSKVVIHTFYKNI